jgi:hypothetical protein
MSVLGRSPLITWDGKVTTFLAAIGGTIGYVRVFLQGSGVYDSFVFRVASEWKTAFPTILKGLQSVSVPNTKVGEKERRTK